MDLNSPVLIWATIGIILLISEVFTGTFYLLFLGVGGFLTAIAVALGLNSVVGQLLCFSIISIILVLLFRKRIVNRSKGFGQDVHEVVQIESDIEVGAEAKVNYQGAPWKAINSGASKISKGQAAEVIKVEGITLYLKRKGE